MKDTVEPPLEKPLGFTALNKRVLILPDKAEATRGKIIIPEAARKSTHRGTVLSVAEDAELLKVGMKVYWPSYAGSEIDLNGTMHIAIDAKELLGYASAS